MDVRSETRRKELERINHQYKEGDLSQEQAMAWLLHAVEQEIQKPDDEIDDAWIDACEQLMNSIEQPQDWPDHRQENWECIQDSIRKANRTARVRAAARAACAAACLVLMLVGVSYSRQWFQATQSPDEQVYTLTGEEVKINMESSASAGESSESGKCTTSDLQELCEFLGYTPQLPTWVPEGWELNGYYASANRESQWITVVYEKTGEKNCLIYDYKQAEDISTISVDFYQDGAGEYVKLKNGMDIYLTTNTDEPVAVWTTSNTYSCATGPVSVEEFKTFILGIQ